MDLLHDPIIYERTNMSLILCRFSVTNQITVWKQFDQPDESWCNDSQYQHEDEQHFDQC